MVAEEELEEGSHIAILGRQSEANSGSNPNAFVRYLSDLCVGVGVWVLLRDRGRGRHDRTAGTMT